MSMYDWPEPHPLTRICEVHGDVIADGAQCSACMLEREELDAALEEGRPAARRALWRRRYLARQDRIDRREF